MDNSHQQENPNSIVAVNSIDMIGCEHPYCEAYYEMGEF